MTQALPVPRTRDEALHPRWLSSVLAGVTGGAAIERVEVVEVIRTMATKIRFKASWDGGEAALCLKGFLDVDEATARGGATTITESDFYGEVAPKLNLHVPICVAAAINRPGQQGVFIMRDLIVDGARFCTALEPFTAERAAASLEQLARLHARGDVLRETPWIRRRIGDFVRNAYVPQAALQELLNGPRGQGLDARTRDASALLKALALLEARDAGRPQTLVHGDAHAGNIFEAPAGPGLIDWQLLQSGCWALDVAYHVCAILAVDLAEREEWALLRHYLAALKRFGGDTPEFETAQAHYRESVVYGFYLWSITRRVDPEITNTFVDRLGRAVMRHDSYRLLGVS